MGVPVDAGELIVTAVVTTLSALDLKPEDAAAARLARLYALRIDQATVTGDPKIAAWAARWIGPELLKALEALGATPAARAAMKKSGKDKPPAQESQLDRLRAARTQKRA